MIHDLGLKSIEEVEGHFPVVRLYRHRQEFDVERHIILYDKVERDPELPHHNQQLDNLGRLQELVVPLNEVDNAMVREDYLAWRIKILPLVVN